MTLSDLLDLGIVATEVPNVKRVFRVDTDRGAAVFYADKEMWQHRGRKFKGDAAAFRDWLKRGVQ